jgi:ketosteroid isomerase-like protein
MSSNKQTVEKYMDSFNRLDHSEILSCLTDDVEWIMPGAFHLKGKEAFDREIENPAFEGKPIIVVTRMLEDGSIVVAEGTAQATKKGGEVLPLVFCDIFEMENGQIRRLISYVMPVATL